MKQSKEKVEVKEVSTKQNILNNVMVGFDAILQIDVKHAFERAKIVPKILADTYCYAKSVTKDKFEALKKELKDISFTFKKGTKEKVYKVIYIHATQCLDEIKNIVKHKKTAKTHATTPKKGALKTRTLAYKKEPEKMVKVNNHKTNYEKKLAKRIKLACRYIDRQQAKKPVTSLKKAKSKGKTTIQTKLKFAA